MMMSTPFAFDMVESSMRIMVDDIRECVRVLLFFVIDETGLFSYLLEAQRWRETVTWKLLPFFPLESSASSSSSSSSLLELNMNVGLTIRLPWAFLLGIPAPPSDVWYGGSLGRGESFSFRLSVVSEDFRSKQRTKDEQGGLTLEGRDPPDFT